MVYWITKNLNQNYQVPKFQLREYFGSDTVHYFADPKFWIPEPSIYIMYTWEFMLLGPTHQICYMLALGFFV